MTKRDGEREKRTKGSWKKGREAGKERRDTSNKLQRIWGLLGFFALVLE